MMNMYLRQFLEKNTTLSEQELLEVAAHILVNSYKKGTVLLKQGDISEKCYVVLKGCVRQYAVGNDGRETTYNFFTEGQSIVLFRSYKLLEGKGSDPGVSFLTSYDPAKRSGITLVSKCG